MKCSALTNQPSTYRVWDTDIGKLFGTYDNENAALDFIRILINTYGEGSANDLTLSREYPDGSFAEPLSGPALLAYITNRVFSI